MKDVDTSIGVTMHGEQIPSLRRAGMSLKLKLDRDVWRLERNEISGQTFGHVPALKTQHVITKDVWFPQRR